MDRTASWLRRRMASSVVTGLLAAIGSFYIWLVLVTVRWEVVGAERRARAGAAPAGFIAAMWHGRLFLSPSFAPPAKRTVAFISNNRDGELITRIVARWKVDAVRGSTYDRAKGRDKGGREAYGEALAALREGACLAITPDGPRGPRMRAQDGVALLAVESGCRVLPVAFSTRRGRLGKGWDRFLVPWPFGRGAIVYGAPLDPPRDTGEAARDAHRLAIEAAVTAVTNEADRICGRDPVPPGKHRA